MTSLKTLKGCWLPAIIATLGMMPMLNANAAQNLRLKQPIRQIAQNNGTTDSQNSLRELARKYAATGEKEKARQTLNQAFEVAKPTAPDDLVSWTDDYAVMGQYSKALEIANSLKDDLFKSKARIAIARAYFKAELYNQAFEVAKLIPDGSLQPVPEYEDPKQVFLKALALKYTQAGLYDRASAIPSALQDVPGRIEVLQIISREYAKVNQPQKASEVLATALAQANKITNYILRTGNW